TPRFTGGGGGGGTTLAQARASNPYMRNLAPGRGTTGGLKKTGGSDALLKITVV
ncbi:hypothetical protein LCGC14_2996330, partial [marine sediment metagenome]